MKAFMMSVVAGVVVLIGVSFIGCESTLLEGIGIGAASSKTISDAEQLARRKKVELARELLDTQAELERAIAVNDVEKQVVLTDKIGELSKKEFYAELGTFIVDTANEGIAKDWTSTDKRGVNLQWLLSASLGAYALYEKRKLLAQMKGIAKFSAQAPPDIAESLYEDIKKYDRKFIP